jgi:hypothetical protein
MRQRKMSYLKLQQKFDQVLEQPQKEQKLTAARTASSKTRQISSFLNGASGLHSDHCKKPSTFVNLPIFMLHSCSCTSWKTSITIGG